MKLKIILIIILLVLAACSLEESNTSNNSIEPGDEGDGIMAIPIIVWLMLLASGLALMTQVINKLVINEKKVEVFAFDPTPNSIRWLETLELPEKFHFHPWAIADRDGSLYLYPRIRGDGSRSKVMYTIMMEKEASGGTEVPARTLRTIMKDLGHEQIDVLKMDI